MDGADFESRFAKFTAQAQEMKEGSVRAGSTTLEPDLRLGGLKSFAG
jgi:hypothetical protein